MDAGKLAEAIVPTGWSILYTVPKGANGVVSINLCTINGAAVTFQLRHIKQGNNGSIPGTALHTITSPILLAGSNVALVDFGVNSLDDIEVYSSINNELVASVNSAGLAYSILYKTKGQI
tara:strand:+ start:5670 stop:6029 length:360 start_codon:yes stop_codon:yes gene_type:complete